MAKISKSAASKSYNQKTISKIKARDAAKSPAPSSSGSSSSGSSSSKTTIATPPVQTSQSAQLDTIKQTLLKMQSDLQGGKVTGTTPTPTPTVTPYPTSPTSSVLTTQQRMNESSAQATRFGLDTKGVVPSTAITNGLTPQQVLDKRAELEQKQGLLSQYQNELAALQKASTEDPMTPEDGTNVNPLTNPDKYLSQYFTTDASRNMTEAQKAQQKLLDESAKATEDFYSNRDNNVEDAYDKYGVTEKQKALSDIQKEMADREVKLRNDVQVLETAPEYRGVSREFANDQREAIKSKGAFDLANLAIVESAYNGDLTTARTLSQDLIDNQFKTFEGKIEGYKARLAALIPTLQAEEKQQALALEAAFDQQTKNLAEKKADTELKYEYMTLAAKAGAPSSVYKAILKATSADEAFMLAAPYMKGTGSSSNGSGASNVVGTTEVVAGLSPFKPTLANIDVTGAKMTDLKKAINAEFHPEFSAKLISSLAEKDVRQFLIMYDAEMRKLGKSIDPDIFLQYFMETTGNTATSGGASSGRSID